MYLPRENNSKQTLNQKPSTAMKNNVGVSMSLRNVICFQLTAVCIRYSDSRKKVYW